MDVNLTQHVLVCALQELGSLVESLGTSAAPLVSEPSTGESQSAIAIEHALIPGVSELVSAEKIVVCSNVVGPEIPLLVYLIS